MKRALVLDANAVIHGTWIPTAGPSLLLYTLPEIISLEIKDETSRHNLSILLQRGLEPLDPSPSSIAAIRRFSKLTGDATVLSSVDLKVLALVYQLEKQLKGTVEHLRAAPVAPETHFGKYGSAAENECLVQEDGWVTSTSSRKQQSLSECISGHTVICITSDRAMQNVLLQLGMSGVFSPDGHMITFLKSWILRCHACGYLERKSICQFCDGCGNPSLIRTSYSIVEGRMVLHLKKNFQYNIRGTQYAVSEKEIRRKDQKEYIRDMKSYERAQRKLLKNPEPDITSDFIHLTLKQAELPVIGAGRRNPNQARRK